MDPYKVIFLKLAAHIFYKMTDLEKKAYNIAKIQLRNKNKINKFTKYLKHANKFKKIPISKLLNKKLNYNIYKKKAF